jgi:hypothetical protein
MVSPITVYPPSIEVSTIPPLNGAQQDGTEYQVQVNGCPVVKKEYNYKEYNRKVSVYRHHAMRTCSNDNCGDPHFVPLRYRDCVKIVYEVVSPFFIRLRVWTKHAQNEDIVYVSLQKEDPSIYATIEARKYSTSSYCATHYLPREMAEDEVIVKIHAFLERFPECDEVDYYYNQHGCLFECNNSFPDHPRLFYTFRPPDSTQQRMETIQKVEVNLFDTTSSGEPILAGRYSSTLAERYSSTTTKDHEFRVLRRRGVQVNTTLCSAPANTGSYKRSDERYERQKKVFDAFCHALMTANPVKLDNKTDEKIEVSVDYLQTSYNNPTFNPHECIAYQFIVNGRRTVIPGFRSYVGEVNALCIYMNSRQITVQKIGDDIEVTEVDKQTGAISTLYLESNKAYQNICYRMLFYRPQRDSLKLYDSLDFSQLPCEFSTSSITASHHNLYGLFIAMQADLGLHDIYYQSSQQGDRLKLSSKGVNLKERVDLCSTSHAYRLVVEPQGTAQINDEDAPAALKEAKDAYETQRNKLVAGILPPALMNLVFAFFQREGKGQL